MTAILGEAETGRRHIVTIPAHSYDFAAPNSVAAEPAPVAFGAQTIPPRFPLQRTEPQRVAQLPWPADMFGEPATIAELQVEVVQLSESQEFRRKRLTLTPSGPCHCSMSPWRLGTIESRPFITICHCEQIRGGVPPSAAGLASQGRLK